MHKSALKRRVEGDKGRQVPMKAIKKKCAKGKMTKRRSIAFAERTIEDLSPQYILCCLNITSIFQRRVKSVGMCLIQYTFVKSENLV